MGTKTFPRKSSTWMNFPLTWIPLTRSWQHIKFIYNCFRDSLKFSDSLKFNLYWHFFTLWVKRWKYAFLKILYDTVDSTSVCPWGGVGHGPYKMRIRDRGAYTICHFLCRLVCGYDMIFRTVGRRANYCGIARPNVKGCSFCLLCKAVLILKRLNIHKNSSFERFSFSFEQLLTLICGNLCYWLSSSFIKPYIFLFSFMLFFVWLF